MLSVVPRAPLPDTPEQMVSLAPELEALPIVAQRVMAMVRDDSVTIERIASGSEEESATVDEFADHTRP